MANLFYPSNSNSPFLKFLGCLALLLLFHIPLVAQENDKDEDAGDNIVSSIVESMAEQREEEDIDFTQLQDVYTNLLEKPINLNTATAEELGALSILTDFQIYSLIQYVKEYGALLSLKELTLVHGFTEETLNLLLPFVTIEKDGSSPPASRSGSSKSSSPKISPKKMLSYGRSRLLLRTQRLLETRKGYLAPNKPDQQYYLGSPQAYYAQYRYKYGQRLQVNLTAESDAGEVFFKGANRRGFDFYSFHLQLADMGLLKKLVVGDFRGSFGQGLTLWNGLSFGKGAEVLNVGRRAAGLTGYTSADESQFMRGVAASLGNQHWTVTPFASRKNIDATISTDTTSTSYSSLTSTGLHRTQNEMARKHVLSETVGGLNLSYHHPFMQVGATAMWYEYGGNDERDLKPYNLYDLHSSTNANASVDFRGMWKNVSFWGEAGMSRNGGKAALAGAMLNMSRHVQLCFLYRNYQPNYQSNYAGAFGTGSKTSNEEGFYWGINVVPFKYWRLSAYFDSYSFPWLRYRVNAPSSGFDYLAQLNYMPTPEVSFHVRLQQQGKKQNAPTGSSPMTMVQDLEYLKVRFQADYALTPELRMQTRLAYNQFRSETTAQQQGTLLYHDIGYKFKSTPLAVTVRYAIFDADNWETRFYAYESDVLYAFSVPAYYGRGMRYYLNTGYKIGKHLQLWLRLAQTCYFNQTEIGSGLSTIEGNKQTDYKLQLMVKF